MANIKFKNLLREGRSLSSKQKQIIAKVAKQASRDLSSKDWANNYEIEDMEEMIIGWYNEESHQDFEEVIGYFDTKKGSGITGGTWHDEMTSGGYMNESNVVEGKLSTEQKTTFLEAIKKFESYGEQIYRENDLKGIAETVSQLSSGAGNFMLEETDDWFDSVTVKKDVKEITNSAALFEKTALEAAGLQHRLESLYEDLGNKLGRYYDTSESLDPVGKEDGDIDNDGDEDKSDEYLANRRKSVKTAINSEGFSIRNWQKSQGIK